MIDPAREVVGLYSEGAPRFDRIFIRLRAGMLPLELFHRALPDQGAVLDLGCGHGVIANYLALRSAKRTVLGLDWDGERIEIARRTVGSRINIRFEVGDLRRVSFPACQAVVLIGVLCLIPFDSWDGLLADCFKRLAPGGVLLINELEPERRGAFAFVRFKEWMMSLLGITKAEGLFVKGTKDLTEQLIRHGFATSSDRLSIPLHPTRLYRAVKPLGAA